MPQKRLIKIIVRNKQKTNVKVCDNPNCSICLNVITFEEREDKKKHK